MSPPRAHSHRHDGRHHRNDDTDAVVHSNLMRKAVNFFNEIHMRGRALAHAESAECGMPYGGVLRMSPMRPKGEKPMQIRSSRVFAIVTVLARDANETFELDPVGRGRASRVDRH